MGGKRKGLTSEEREELVRLRRENRRLQGDVEVSRAGYYQRKKDMAWARELSDAELTAKIRQVHDESKGTYGSPRVHRELLARQVGCGRRRVRRLMRLAGLEGRCQKRWRKTTIQDPAAQGEALDLIRRHFGPGEVLDARYVGDCQSAPIPHPRDGKASPPTCAPVVPLVLPLPYGCRQAVCVDRGRSIRRCRGGRRRRRHVFQRVVVRGRPSTTSCAGRSSGCCRMGRGQRRSDI